MQFPKNEERRPLETDGDSDSSLTKRQTSSGFILAQDTAEAIRQQLDGAYCVLVLTPADTVRRRVFLSLHAAEKHAARAEARGCLAGLYLCRLDPVGQVRA